MRAFKDTKHALVADVDCTAGGKDLCSEVGIKGYPTIKYGDPNNLEDYNGGRDYSSLKEFADKNLGPACGPNNLDLCGEEKKAMIVKIQAMSAADLDKEIAAKEAEMETLEANFKTFVEGLSKQYQEESKKKEEAVAAIKSGGHSLMKIVKAAARTAGHSEL